MNIKNILDRARGVVTIDNLQRVVNSLLSQSSGFDPTSAITFSGAVEFTGDVDLSAANITDEYKEYTGIVRFNGSNAAPVVTVFKNTLTGTPTWAKVSDGLYTITLTGAFPYAKTWVLANTGVPTLQTTNRGSLHFYPSSDDNSITILNEDLETIPGAPAAIVSVTQVAFQIRVYP